jgi:hypothetical protein
MIARNVNCCAIAAGACEVPVILLYCWHCICFEINTVGSSLK